MSILGTSSRLISRTTCSACCQQSQRRLAHKLVEVELIRDVPSLGRRGDRLPISPGRARNALIPSGQALYVVNGKAISAVRDLLAKEGAREAFAASGSLRKHKKASDVLDAMVDGGEQARASDAALLQSLSLLPLPLTFYRRTTGTTSTDLFGSVTATDVVAAVREYGIVLEESQGGFAGVEKGRVKSLGTFEYEVSLKALEQTFSVAVEVRKEEGAGHKE